MAMAQQTRRAVPADWPTPPPVRPIHPLWPRIGQGIAQALCVVLVVAIWELIVHLGGYPQFILPTPGEVLARVRDLLLDGTLVTNGAATLQEALVGFLVAALLALPLGYTFAHVPLLERFFTPIIAGSQAVPAVAIAPLLVLWLNNGLAPKVAICAVIVFFPLLVTTITGVRGVPREYVEVAAVFGAPWWEKILRVELPLAAPVLLGGVKLGLTLSLTGAVVGEFVSSSQGLGFLVNFYGENQDTTSVFAALVALSVIAIALYTMVSIAERVVAGWQG